MNLGPRYALIYHPFPASAIIGAGMGGAMACSCYLAGIDAGNTLAASVGAGLAVGTAVSIPLVITHQWILLKTMPWAEKQFTPLPKPEYPELLTYQATIPNLAIQSQAMFPPIDRYKLHRGFQVALRYGTVSVRNMRDAKYTEEETRLFRDWLFERDFAVNVRGAAELNDAGKAYLDRYSPTARGYRL